MTYQYSGSVSIEFDSIDVLHCVWTSYPSAHGVLSHTGIVYIDLAIGAARAEDVTLLYLRIDITS